MIFPQFFSIIFSPFFHYFFPQFPDFSPDFRVFPPQFLGDSPQFLGFSPKFPVFFSPPVFRGFSQISGFFPLIFRDFFPPQFSGISPPQFLGYSPKFPGFFLLIFRDFLPSFSGILPNFRVFPGVDPLVIPSPARRVAVPRRDHAGDPAAAGEQPAGDPQEEVVGGGALPQGGGSPRQRFGWVGWVGLVELS